MFIGLSRFSGMEKSPSFVRVDNNGRLTPFPGGAWNTWAPGQDGSSALVMVNANPLCMVKWLHSALMF
ncbi:hypothetical protein A0U92_01555 [Acetobacter aceti]|uniref:Uncharacterized protein n=2 Tax=Acetobacter aceti TaxID=435 RepID=A0A1U9KD41_ACEAC|nr:hypothetical protein A0U92_01555 [Acetobacter aceti]